MKLKIVIFYLCLPFIFYAMEKPEPTSLSSIRESLDEKDFIPALDALLQTEEPDNHLKLLIALSNDPGSRKAFHTSISNFLNQSLSITSEEELETAVSVKTDILRKALFDRLKFYYDQPKGKSVFLDGPTISPQFSSACIDEEIIILTSKTKSGGVLFSSGESWENKIWGIWDINTGKFLKKVYLEEKRPTEVHDLVKAMVTGDTLSLHWLNRIHWLNPERPGVLLCNIKLDGLGQHWYSLRHPCESNDYCFAYVQKDPETSNISINIHDVDTQELINVVELGSKCRVKQIAVDNSMLAAKILKQHDDHPEESTEVTVLWNYRTGDLIKEFESSIEDEDQTMQVKLHHPYLLFTQLDRDNNLFDVVAYNYSSNELSKLDHTLKAIESMEIFGNWLHYKTSKNTLRFVNLDNPTIKQIFTYSFPASDAHPLSEFNHKQFNALGFLDHYLITQAAHTPIKRTSKVRWDVQDTRQEIKIWDIPTGECLKTLEGNCIGLLPDQKTIVYEPLHGRLNEFCKYELPRLEESIKLMLATNNSLLSAFSRTLKWWFK